MRATHRVGFPKNPIGDSSDRRIAASPGTPIALCGAGGHVAGLGRAGGKRSAACWRPGFFVGTRMGPPASTPVRRSQAPSPVVGRQPTGGAGQFAEVWMKIEPKPRDTGVEFTQSLSGQNVDRVFVPSVEKGVMKACEEGIGDIKLEPLRLSANFRSDEGVVTWVNATFPDVMPVDEDIATGGKVPYEAYSQRKKAK